MKKYNRLFLNNEVIKFLEITIIALKLELKTKESTYTLFEKNDRIIHNLRLEAEIVMLKSLISEHEKKNQALLFKNSRHC